MKALKKILTLLSSFGRRRDETDGDPNQVRPTGEMLDDPLFGRLRWSPSPTGGWGWGEFLSVDGRSAILSVSSKAMGMEGARRLYSRITADLAAVHERLADEHLPDLNKYLWANSPMTREAFLSRFQLCRIDMNDDGSVYVEFDDASGEDILSGHGIGFIFYLDGTVESAGSG